MRIRVEPKEFFMYSVFFAFNKAHADSEDEAVKAYLEERELEPKAKWVDTLDDQEHDVMYFGGCYLGRHLQVIGDMQRKAVEREMLTKKIESTLKETTDPTTRSVADSTSEPRLKEMVASLAQEFHQQESSFGTDEEGFLKVALEPDLIQQRFMELAGDRG